MDSSLPVTKQENPHEGNLVLDAPAELLQKSILKAQHDASLRRCNDYRLDYEELLRKFSYEFYELDPSCIKNESASQYELLERSVRRRVKITLLKYISLISGGFIGTFFLDPIMCFLYSIITPLIILLDAISELAHLKNPTWLARIKFFWFGFQHKRIASKIEKQKVH